MPKQLVVTVGLDVHDSPGSMTVRAEALAPGASAAFPNDPARSDVLGHDLAAGYSAMAADEAREADADSWGEAMIGDIAEAPAAIPPGEKCCAGLPPGPSSCAI